MILRLYPVLEISDLSIDVLAQFSHVLMRAVVDANEDRQDDGGRNPPGRGFLRATDPGDV